MSADEGKGAPARKATKQPEIDLVGELDKVLDIVERASKATSRYDASLDSISRGLTGDIQQGEFRSVIDRLKQATQQVIDENRTLNVSLRKTRAEMHSMRETLSVARREAMTDALTDLANRRHFDSIVDLTVAQAQTRRTPLALLLLDVDHFKRFNDERGHQVGDQVLRLVAAALRQHIPEGGTAARYGGEEFVALLPEIDLTRAWRTAESIRVSIGGKDLIKRATSERIGRVTISLGVASLKHSDTAASLIERADRCLQGAKALGRDRVVGENDLPVHMPVRRAG